MSWPTKKLGEVLMQIAKSLWVLLSKKEFDNISPEKTQQTKEKIMAPVKATTPIVEEKVVNKTTEEPRINEANLLPQFIHSEPNLANGENTKRVREYIKYEFSLNFDTDCLQCVEYAQYRVKQKLGIWIEWPIKSGRDAKYWPSILGPRYKVSEIPVVNSVASFDAPSLGVHGHVVFIENVFPNGEIEISEVNLPRDGIYNLKRMAPAIWRDRYKGKFIIFS